MLPGIDGIALCRKLRQARASDSQFLMLTARDRVCDRVIGLDAGADDYLVKPFRFTGTFGSHSGSAAAGGGNGQTHF